MSNQEKNGSGCKVDSATSTAAKVKFISWLKFGLWPLLIAAVALVVAGFVAGQLEETLDLLIRNVDECSTWNQWIRVFAKACFNGVHLGVVPAIVISLAAWPFVDRLDEINISMLKAGASISFLVGIPLLMMFGFIVFLLILLKIYSVWTIALLILITAGAFGVVFADVRGISRSLKNWALQLYMKPEPEKKDNHFADKYKWLLMDRLLLSAIFLVLGCAYPHFLPSWDGVAQKEIVAEICQTKH